MRNTTIRYKNIVLLLLLLSLYIFPVKAQRLDSLLKKFDTYKTKDTFALKLLLALAFEYEDINPDKGVEFAEHAAVLARKLNADDQLACAYLVKAENSSQKGDLKTAFVCIEKALDLNKQIANKTGIAASLNDLGRAYSLGPDYARALGYYEQALELNKPLSNKEQTARIFANMALYYARLYDYLQAIVFFQKSLALYEEIKISSEQARMLSSIGRCYYLLADFSKALEYLQKALKLNEQLKNKPGIAFNYYYLGQLYGEINATKGLEYYEHSLALYEKMDAKYHIADILNDIGTNYTSRADSGRIPDYQQKALEFYLRALKLNEQLNDQPGIAINLGNLAFNYICSSDFYKAMECLEKALSINQEKGNKYLVADNLETIALVYYTAPDKVLRTLEINPHDKYAKAIEKMKAALELFKETRNTVRQTWELLRIHDVYIKADRYDSAYHYYKQFIVLRDSTFNIAKQKGVVADELADEYGKKEDSLKFNQQLTEEKLKGQVLLAKQQQQQLELNKKELDLSNKEKDLQKLAYLKTQADLQNEQLEKKGKEKQLTLSEKEKQLQQEKVKTLTQEKKLAALKQQQQWVYIVSAVILLGFATFYFFYRSRLQQGRLKTEIAAERIGQQQKEAEFQRQLGDISLSALRSQMNPHFIFNCLNSIKLYTTQNDTVAASEYLTKFSRLIRLVLENSRNDRITLASELDALRLYMEMEAMRFKEKLKYTISVEKEVDLDYIEIPPLLLQPYVENAIWHGLMQKEKGGRIDVTVGLQPAESMLVINITDNGIGRARSAELMSKTATKHKSYGMKVTSERLALINRVYKTGAHVAIDDLTGNTGQAIGTRVTIKIPLE
jgi:tetratricopeptide (TPR) repeat protein